MPVLTPEPVPLVLAFVAGPFLLLFGLAVALMGIAGWRGLLPRNAVLGIRTPQTMASEPAWSAAHRSAGPWLVGAGFGSMTPGALVLFRPTNETFVLATMAGLALLVGLVAVAAAMASRAASQTSHQPRRDLPDPTDK